MLKVGLNGIDFSNGNLGCQALAYSLINSLNEINKDISYILFVFEDNLTLKRNLCERLKLEEKNVEFFVITIKSLSNIKQTSKKIKSCDIVIDMSGGDSFSDIYGMKRMLRESFYKLLTLHNKIPIILGPQTYGPYYKSVSRFLAKKIIKKANCIFTRDQKSYELIKDLTGRTDIFVSTDLAMRLPYCKDNYKLEKNAIGINVSALMWYEGNYKGNRYGIKLDYKEYIESLINYIKETKKYTIYLLSHVNATGVEEDDYKLCEELSIKYGIKLAPKFKDSIDAKSFISNLNLLIASRMHATIAAFSTLVPTLPVSYSKKFEGLYENLKYTHFIDARKNTTEEAVNKTIFEINNIDIIKVDEKKSFDIANNKLEIFDTNFKKVLSNTMETSDNDGIKKSY